jgi:hypothetical protein
VAGLLALLMGAPAIAQSKTAAKDTPWGEAFTRTAREDRVQGFLVIEVTVDSEGCPASAKVLKPLPDRLAGPSHHCAAVVCLRARAVSGSCGGIEIHPDGHVSGLLSVGEVRRAGETASASDQAGGLPDRAQAPDDDRVADRVKAGDDPKVAGSAVEHAEEEPDQEDG